MPDPIGHLSIQESIGKEIAVSLRWGPVHSCVVPNLIGHLAFEQKGHKKGISLGPRYL